MSTNVGMITSIHGDYDQLVTQPSQTVEAEWVAVVDHEHEGVETWHQIVEPRPNLHPRLAAKIAKCMPWRYFPLESGYTPEESIGIPPIGGNFAYPGPWRDEAVGSKWDHVYIWMDGSCRLLREDSIAWLLEQSEGHMLTQFKHPWRNTWVEEAEASAPLPKYQNQRVIEQSNHYLESLPIGDGLWATGLIVYRALDGGGSWGATDCSEIYQFGANWLLEQVIWSYQDQVSQPQLVMYTANLRPHELALPDGSPAPLHGNEYIGWDADHHNGPDAT